MNAMRETPLTPEPARLQIVQLTNQACELTKAAVSSATDFLRTGSVSSALAVGEREKELDDLDREVDEYVTAAISQVSPLEARELLTCMKLVVELERIGDLLLSFVSRGRFLPSPLEGADFSNLLGMSVTLEKMLADCSQAFTARDLERAIAVLRSDAEIDRLRNLIFIRHTEDHAREGQKDSFHVLAMAQALERAGDHAKNAAEEIVHLTTGRSIRHILRRKGMSYEQLYIQSLRKNVTTKSTE